MAITDISIPLQYIKSGTLAKRPASGQFEGQIYYATDVDLSYVWDGTEWQETTVDLNNVIKLIGLNALNILDLTAQSSLTVGINANFERDIYTDANGYLNTVDTGNTTAIFDINKYSNLSYGADSVNTISYPSPSSMNATLTSKIYITATSDKFITKITRKESGIKRCYIYDETETTLLATGKLIENDFLFNFQMSNETTYHIFFEKDSSTPWQIGNYNGTVSLNDFDFIGSSFISNNPVGASSITCNVGTLSDLKIQTNPQTIESGFTKFMIVSNEETSGTGSVTYDITFDGTNYQEDLESFKEYSIEEAGTSLILKQNLNAGASSGTANAYNWGVLLW